MSLSTTRVQKAAVEPPHDDSLDDIFHALADRTRRAMLVRLARGPASVSELATPFEMTLPGASKHLRVLEHAGLVERSVQGRVHRCSLRPGALEAADRWIAQQRAFWGETLDALERYAATQQKSAAPRRARR
jgi:DNA-binding transcriptional ArsR family regulator